MKRTHDSIEFTFPRNGVMLTETAGERIGDTLKIRVFVESYDNRKLTCNGVPMERYDFERYRLDVILDNFKTELIVKDEDNGQTVKSTVFFLKKGYKKYRFSLDDNIWFLQNLTEHKDEYKSMFEDPYLNLLQTIHNKYGTKFHVNIYYETPRHGGFNLTQMTDKYKPEWKENSDWLRLCFHANADLPNRPYGHVTYEQMYFEAKRVNDEILRFAGEEAFTKTVMTVHWGDCSIEGARALRDLGYKAFVSSYNWDGKQSVDIRMYCDELQCNILQKFGFFYDTDEDMYHFRYNGGIQHIPVENICPQFETQERNFPFYRFKDICLHEQYFYPEFSKHQPNYFEKMDTVCGWCKEHGYEPIFMDELFEFDTH